MICCVHLLTSSLYPTGEIDILILLATFYCRVVKEELADDEALLPCTNGRVVCWVSAPLLEVTPLVLRLTHVEFVNV